MKNILLFIFCTVLSYCGYGQRTHGAAITRPAVDARNYELSATGRTCYIGGTDTLRNMPDTQSHAIYIAGLVDSGFTAGMNAFGDHGYAERYDFHGSDSTLIVTGVMTLFSGMVNPFSPKTITLYTWAVAPPVGLRSHVVENGFPGTIIASVVEPVPQLGIAVLPANPDTFKIFNFTSPTFNLFSSFFVGYEMTYDFLALAGDTIALASSLDAERTSPLYTVAGMDTFINNQNVVLFNDGSGWHDYATGDFGLDVDFFVFPIVAVRSGNPLSVNGITNKNLTFYGNYPNPAINSTNVKFSLAKNADVTLIVTDANGHTLQTISRSGMLLGENSITIETGNYAAGNYCYMIRNSAGGGIAGKFTVVR